MAITDFTLAPVQQPIVVQILKLNAFAVPVAQTSNAVSLVPATGQQIPPQQRLF